jgi:hypothetical protein
MYDATLSQLWLLMLACAGGANAVRVHLCFVVFFANTQGDRFPAAPAKALPERHSTPSTRGTDPLPRTQPQAPNRAVVCWGIMQSYT